MNTTMASFTETIAEQGLRISLFRAMHGNTGNMMPAVKPSAADKAKYPFLKIPFAFTHCIAEPGEGFEIILETFSKLPQYTLVAACNWSSSEKAASLMARYSGFRNIILVNAENGDQDIHMIRSGCFLYIHGGSHEHDHQLLAGAMMLGLPVICYYSALNKTITGDKSFYYSCAEELKQMILTKSIIDLKQLGMHMKMVAGYSMI